VNTTRYSAGTTVAIRMRDIAHSWNGSTSNPRRLLPRSQSVRPLRPRCSRLIRSQSRLRG
jgi:hypothetical protein